jgi:hypothetical protein
LFVSNSGHDDAFGSVSELCRSSRSGLHLDAHNVPYFNYKTPINAYALDYWQHESVRPLVAANGLRQGEIWFELQNFAMALATLLASLRVLLIDRVAADLETGEEDQSEEELEDELGIDKLKIEDEDEALGDDEVPGKVGITSRPVDIPDEDWIVYEAFLSVTNKFHEKWQKMWA